MSAKSHKCPDEADVVLGWQILARDCPEMSDKRHNIQFVALS